MLNQQGKSKGKGRRPLEDKQKMGFRISQFLLSSVKKLSDTFIASEGKSCTLSLKGVATEWLDDLAGANEWLEEAA